MRYYVYALLDSRVSGDFSNEYATLDFKPFYIGKGDFRSKNKSIRHLMHYKLALSGSKTSLRSNPEKHRTIRKLFELGHTPNYAIIFSGDIESEAFDVEVKMIGFYGKSSNGGLLSNISDGGCGGNTIDTVEGLKEKLRDLASKRWSGSGNPNYDCSLEDTPSHKAKASGSHWNQGRSQPLSTKNAIRNSRRLNLTKVVRIDPATLVELETLDSLKALELYFNSKSKTQLYRALNHGGIASGFLWKREGKDLILTKKNRTGYVPPKRVKNRKRVYYKFDVKSDEIVFSNASVAALALGICEGIVKRKCISNNTVQHIFRWENGQYNFNISKGHRREVVMTDIDGAVQKFDSLTMAAKHVDASISAVLAACVGRRKTCKKRHFKYADQ